MSEETDGRTKRWFVLLVAGGSDVLTENPRCESFFSEKEAIAFAKECCRDDPFDNEAIYHIMKSTHIIEAKRRVTVSVLPIK